MSNDDDEDQKGLRRTLFVLYKLGGTEGHVLGVRLRLRSPGKCHRSGVGSLVVECETTTTEVIGPPTCVVEAVSPHIGCLEPFAGARSGLGGQWGVYQQGGGGRTWFSGIP